MKKNYVDGLVTGSDFDDFFLLKSMAVRVGSNQKKYIDMILSDKTGDVSAKKWDASDKCNYQDTGFRYGVAGQAAAESVEIPSGCGKR